MRIFDTTDPDQVELASTLLTHLATGVRTLFDEEELRQAFTLFGLVPTLPVLRAFLRSQGWARPLFSMFWHTPAAVATWADRNRATGGVAATAS